jgi:hypothetical protein
MATTEPKSLIIKKKQKTNMQSKCQDLLQRHFHSTKGLEKAGFRLDDDGRLKLHSCDVDWGKLASSALKYKTIYKQIEALSRLRATFVPAMIELVIDELGLTGVCGHTSSGSSNVVSDLDVTITGWEGRCEVIILFNEVFYGVFGAPSAIIFDVNLYVAPFTKIYKAQANKFPDTHFMKLRDDSQSVLLMTRVSKCNQSYNRSQRGFAFMKLFLFADKDAKLHIHRLLDAATRSQLHRDVATGIKMCERFKTYRSIHEQNQDYAKALTVLSRVQRRLTQNMTDTKCIERYEYRLAVCATLAQEGGFTRGNLSSIVLEGQRKLLNVEVSLNGYVDAIIENTADLLKTLKHHEKDKCHDNVVLLTKYLSRIVDAALKAHLVGQELSALYGVTENVRSTVRGKSGLTVTHVKDAAANVLVHLNHGKKCDIKTIESKVVDMTFSFLNLFYELLDQCQEN